LAGIGRRYICAAVLPSGIRVKVIRSPDIERRVLMRVKNKSVTSLAGRLRRRGRKALPVEGLSR
jgi:hypothetical protein